MPVGVPNCYIFYMTSLPGAYPRRRTSSHPLRTQLCELLDIEYPILQAGMGRSRGSTTTPALVAAVSEAGGMGCLGATGLDAAEISTAVADIRRLTAKPFGVNLLLPARLSDVDLPREDIRALLRREYPQHWQFVQELEQTYGLDCDQRHQQRYAVSPTLIHQQIEAVLDEGVPVFVAGLGDPAIVVPRARPKGMRVLGVVGGIRQADRQVAAGVDAIIAQGAEGGGHTGTISTFTLLPQVIDRVAPLPVIAAGGIADGRGIVAALAFGAQGVWCGTSFLFATEAAVFAEHRAQLSAASSTDTVVSRSYTGKPSRIVRNAIVEAWAASGLDPLPMPLQGVLMDDFNAAAEAADQHGLINSPAGQAAGMLSDHRPAREIVERLVRESVETLARLAS